MKITSLITAFVCSSALSVAAQAALIDRGSYITDTTTGLDWLKLTETAGRTYEDISSNLGSGQEFDGWTYATQSQFANLLWDNGIYDAGLLGNLQSVPFADSYLKSTNEFTPWDFMMLFGNIDPFPSPSDGLRSTGLLDAVEGAFGYAHLFSYYNNSYEDNKLWYGIGAPELNCESCYNYQRQTSVYGSYLVRVSDVPLPGAVLLFGSSILGLAGLRLGNRS